MRELLRDTIFFQTMFALTSGVILMDFARTLVPGNDTLIGLLAAIPTICQLLQAPTILLVERVRNRRLICVASTIAGRAVWFVYPVIPFIANKGLAAALLIFTQLWYYAMTNIAACAISSWLRDLVPEHRISGYFGKRMAISTAMGALTMGAIWLFLPGKEVDPARRLNLLAACFFVGGLAGMASSWFIARGCEPDSIKPGHTPLRDLLRAPFADAGFRRYLGFNAAWFTVYGMTWQFFPKHLRESHGLHLDTVVMATMAGLLLNAFFFRLWARVAVKHGDRALIHGALPLYLLSLALWPAAEFTPAAWRGPLALAAFLVCGIAFSGMQLGITNFALKSAPRGQGTAYLAANAIIAGLSASAGAFLGGVAADTLDGKGWFAGLPHPHLPVGGLTAVFTAAIFFGFYALRRLEKIGDATEPPSRRDIYGDVFAEAASHTTALGAFLGARRVSPIGLLLGKSRAPADKTDDPAS